MFFSTFVGEFQNKWELKLRKAPLSAFLIKVKVMQKNLVIVESPAKAKTIEKFLGKDFKVLSSYGHIRDLKKKEFSIDIDKNFKPNYEIPADKKELVTKLQAEAQKADVVWLASDEDREGEAIAWHLYEVLKLKPEQTRRIVFHEITKNAILKAIENPREIDINRFNAFFLGNQSTCQQSVVEGALLSCQRSLAPAIRCRCRKSNRQPKCRCHGLVQGNHARLPELTYKEIGRAHV